MPPITRRAVLVGGAAFVATASFPHLVRALPTAAAADQLSHDAFMSLSNALVNHQLRPDVGALIATHAQQAFPHFAQSARTILSLAQSRPGMQVEDFFDDIPEGDARALAHWIIAAWYSGMSGSGHDATMFTYEHALTYQVTQDMAPVPSYGFSGPNQWDERVNAPLSPIPTF